jgi:chromosome segregation ATPase
MEEASNPITRPSYKMPPATTAPRELLWYHQLQRENRHLLERINQQQTDMDKIKTQMSASQGRADETRQMLSELDAKQAAGIERRREEFEHEKEILRRVRALEDAVEALRKRDDSQAVLSGITNQCDTLEQRMGDMENRQVTTSDQNMQHLKLRLNLLEQAMIVPGKDSAFKGIQESSEEQVAKVISEVSESAKINQRKEGEIARQTRNDEIRSEPQSPDRVVQPKVVQLRRRPEREKRIPFRPTPPDVWYTR